MGRETDAADSLGEEGSPKADRHLAENFGMTIKQVREFDPQTLDVTRACKFLGLPLKRFDLLATQLEARARWVESVAGQKKDLIATFPEASKELKEMLEAIRKFALRKCLKPDSPALVDRGGTTQSHARSAARKAKTRNLLIGGGVLAAILLAGGVLVVFMSTRGKPQEQRDTAAMKPAEQVVKSPDPMPTILIKNLRGEGTSTDVKAAEFIPLFNGRDMTGWKSYGKPTWAWVDGRLVGTPAPDKSPGFLMTEASYTDFEIELEYKASTAIGSGLFLRGVSDGPVSGAEQLEIQIMDDSDDSTQARQTYKTGSVFAAFARKAEPKITNGDWNALRVKLYGRKIEVWVNGTQTIEADLDNARSQFGKFPGLARASGRVGLQQNQSTDVQFRNVRVKKFDGTDQGGAWPANGFTPLFNGKDLTGWDGLPNTWRAAGGTVVGKLAPGRITHTFLCSQKQYTDFELTCQIMLKNGVGNSGIQVRSKIINPAEFFVAGPQVEVDAFKYAGIYGERTTGNYLKQIPEADVRRIFRANAFNDYLIRCVGKRMTVIVNGTTIADEEFPEIDDSGIIAFQLHGKMRVDELTIKDAMIVDLSKK